MAVKVGDSWVSEAALTYAKEKVDSETVATLKELSDRYPGVNFSTNTQPFSQKGTNNIQIAPDILSQMKNDPEKRLEYEALIYDCAQLVYDGKMEHSGNGFHTKAAGTIINADGSLSGWAISESDDGKQIRNKANLDKNKKETWTDKILAKQKEKRAAERKEEKIRIRKEQEEKRIEKKSDRVNLSDKAQALLDEMKRKYSNMDFFVADYSSSEEASRIMSRGSKEYGVLLDPETLEAMAKDEDTKNKYMSIIDGATEKIDDIKEKFGENTDYVSHIGFSVSKDGSVSFFADLEKTNEKQYKVKKANVEALSVEDLIEKIKHVDWHSVPERAKYSGERIDLFV